MPNRIRSLLRRSVGARALVFVALIALVQGILIGRMIALQRDGAHIIDINGAQRMRTQRIAYLALVARTGIGEANWRLEMHDTVDAMLVVRRELIARWDLSPTVRDADGGTPVGHAVERYARAARALEADPHDAAAFASIMTQRLPLLASIDRTVKIRSQLIERRNTQLLGWSVLGLCAMFGAMLFAWKRVVEPGERRASELVAKLNDNEAQMRSLFTENPDAIAIYDLEGRLVRGNRASGVLLGTSASDVIGKHFQYHIAPAQSGVVSTAFARAIAGESVAFDTVFRNARNDKIDVHATLFPNVIDGRTIGVVGVAKDTRALRRAENAYAAQSERITELYRVSAFQNRSWKRQVEETLAVAAQRLGYEWGTAAEIIDGVARPIALVGEAGFEDGRALPLAPAIVDAAKATRDVWAIDDLERSPLSKEPTVRAMPWRALVGIPLVVGDATFGAVVLGARHARERPNDAGDRDFLRLVTTLVAASIQRGQQEQKLDALAFFDALTGLPNRVLLADRMKQFIAAATRRKLRFAVHCLDLDRFKAVNDAFGHATGDEVLRVVAHRMTACTREEDTLARVGGDEFVILQAIDANGRGAEELARRVLASLAAPFHINGVDHTLGISIGISVFPSGGLDQATLLASADEALLRAKVGGRNRFEFAV